MSPRKISSYTYRLPTKTELPTLIFFKRHIKDRYDQPVLRSGCKLVARRRQRTVCRLSQPLAFHSDFRETEDVPFCHHYKHTSSLPPCRRPGNTSRRTHQSGELDYQGECLGRGCSFVFIRSTRKGEDVNITYKGGATIVREDGYETTLVDKRPELEI